MDFLIGRCHVNRKVILQIRSATPIQDMNMSAPILYISADVSFPPLLKFATLRLVVETMPIYKAVASETEIMSFTANDMFKLQITLDRQNARQKLIYCLQPDPPLFSLPSTFK